MPEIKNTFTSGKMNKDLDERLVPKNEYRDALNIDIATTEGSDIGSAQNSYGNLKVSNLSITGAECIGSIVNPENQNVIWFISGTSVDAIAEYNQAADAVEPILVDNHGGSVSFLNFKVQNGVRTTENNLVTGINIIDGLLFWTDGENEPKKINIDRFKLGCTNFSTTSKFVKLQGDGSNNITSDDVLEEHITVIKQYPLNAPDIALFEDAGGTTDPSLSVLEHPTNTSRRSTGDPFATGSTATNEIYNTNHTFALTAGLNSTTATFAGQGGNAAQWDCIQPNMTFVDSSGNVIKDSNNNVIGVVSVQDDPGGSGTYSTVTLTAAPNSTINSGTIVGFRWALSTYQNESFWTYRNEDNIVVVKPPGTNSKTPLKDKDGAVVLDSNSRQIMIQKLVFSPRPNYKEGDIIELTAPDTTTTLDEDDNVRIRLKLLEEDTTSLVKSNSTRKVFDATILSISPAIATMPVGDLDRWDVTKETDTSIFEDVFPRFAYRWRYDDGEFSCISPFSEVAFLPTSTGYELDAEIGYNKNMENSVSLITLSNFDTKPPGVERLEVLVKFSDATNIYKFKTIDSDQLSSFTSLDITSDQVNAMLPSNQLLRPYDNVPTSARAQEITANRLLYANYKQQRNLTADKPIFKLEMTSSGDYNSSNNAVKSIKSLRTYQLGVSLLDKYGRQTPVFSPSFVNPEQSKITIGQNNSFTTNEFFATYDFDIPNWATHLKYYIKEPKGEYYNITMDRIYQNETEEFAWVSFPTSDINKVQVGDNIVLKKAHDASSPFLLGYTPTYKVLEKQGSAPDVVRVKRKLLGRLENCLFGTNSDNTTGYPIENGVVVRIRGNNGIANIDALKNSATTTSTNRFIRIGSFLKNTVSQYYEVDSITRVDSNSDGDFTDNDDYYEFTLKKPFGTDINFVGGAPGSSTRAEYFELYEDQIKEFDEEFEGRFYIKILKDDTLFDHVIAANSDTGLVYGIKSTEKMYWIQNIWTRDGNTDPDADNVTETGYAPSPDGDTSQDNPANSNFYGNDTATYLINTYKGAGDNQVWNDHVNASQNPDPSEHMNLNLNHYLTQQDGGGATVSGVMRNGFTYNGSRDISRTRYGKNNQGPQRYAIDQAWGWVQHPTSLPKSQSTTYDDQRHMGHGFRLGQKEIDIRLFNIGPGYEKKPAFPNGYVYEQKVGPNRMHIEKNYTLYKALKTIGTKFRWTDDPTETIYTIKKSELIDVNNWNNISTDPAFHDRNNQGVRWHITLDKPIAWSPTSHTVDGTTAITTDPNGNAFNQLNKRIRPYDGTAKSDPDNRRPDGHTYPDGTTFTSAGWTNAEKQSNTSELQILKPITNRDTFSSSNPAVFEVQPKETTDLNIYHEIPTTTLVLKSDMYIETDVIKPDGTTDTNVYAANAQITLGGSFLSPSFTIKGATSQQVKHVEDGSMVTIYTKDDNGNVKWKQKVLTVGTVYAPNVTINNGNTPNFTTIQTYYYKIPLNFSNCFSYGNGVESNRVKDNFNAPQIDLGPRVSTTFLDVYKEEELGSGIIYSGIFNSKSGVNNLNQFIQAEKITKDLNPSYGTIQKLHTRNTNVLAFCEHKVLKILANKDALFNADGNANLTSTNNVLGQSVPFAGEFGISKNPESFASYGYRVYFTDKNRNAVLRLSNDGLTNISDYGMSTFFKDNLSAAGNIIGSYDEDKDTYNLTLNSKTVSFSEKVNGWSSLKSFLPENGFSVSGDYYTVFGGELYQHNASVLRNNFYGTQYNSTIKFIFNDAPSKIKSFKALNYEGTTSRIYQSDNDDITLTTNGWYSNRITTNKQQGQIPEFKEKEGKWFNFIQGTTNTINNLDPEEFSVQGLGVCSAVTVTSGTHNTQYTQSIRIFSPETSPTLSLVGSIYGSSGGASYSTSQTGNPAAIGQTHSQSGFTLNSAVKITGTAVASLQYLRDIVSGLEVGETYTISADVTFDVNGNPNNKAMGFSQRSGVSASARRTTTGVISETFVATNTQIDLFKGKNVAGNMDNIAIAKTSDVEERYPKYIINTSQHKSSSTTKEITVNRQAGSISSENQYFYIHPQIVNGQKWSILASDVTITETSDPSSLMGTVTKADGYINNGTWTSSTAHQGLHTNVVRLTVPISGTMPAYDIVSLLKASLTMNLTQN